MTSRFWRFPLSSSFLLAFGLFLNAQVLYADKLSDEGRLNKWIQLVDNLIKAQEQIIENQEKIIKTVGNLKILVNRR